jgi:hypothetical protein
MYRNCAQRNARKNDKIKKSKLIEVINFPLETLIKILIPIIKRVRKRIVNKGIGEILLDGRGIIKDIL